MDYRLLKALHKLYFTMAKRAQKREASSCIQALEVVEPAKTDVFKANLADPPPRDQQDLMAFPFFSLEKSKRTRPIVYEQGDVKVEIAGLSTVGIATIWDADFLIWVAAQLNAAVERGESPTRRLWIVPYQFLRATKRISPKTTGKYAYERFKDCLQRLQGTTVKTTIKAGGKQITRAWSWIDSWEVHEDESGRMTGIEVVLSEWFFSRVVDDRAVLAIHSDYFLLTGGIERWLYRLARKHCGSNQTGWSFTLHKLYEKYPPGREFRFFKRDLKGVVKSDCLPEYHTAWETTSGIDWVHFSLRQGAQVQRYLPRSLR